jgi:hypothetical protein
MGRKSHKSKKINHGRYYSIRLQISVYRHTKCKQKTSDFKNQKMKTTSTTPASTAPTNLDTATTAPGTQYPIACQNSGPPPDKSLVTNLDAVDRGEVAAIRFNGGRRWWTVWWVGLDKPYRLPFKNLDCIDADKLEEARQKPGKRVKLTGAKCGSVDSSERSGSVVPCGLGLGLVGHVPVKHQVKGKFCALLSVANVVDLPSALHDHIRDQGGLFELEGVRAILNEWPGTPCQLHCVKRVQRTDLLAWLLEQTEGVFTVEFNGHCVSWDAARQLILETDPGFPFALWITAETVAALGIKQVEKAYRIVKCGGKKRKRH